MTDLIQSFQAGGPFMYCILFFGLASVGLIFDRYFALYQGYKSAPTDFRQNLLSLIASGQFSQALDLTKLKLGDSSLGRICEIGIRIRLKGGGEDELQARMDENLSKELARYDKRVSFLSVFANVSTLFGLLGTVTGLISSFAGVAQANPVERANLLSTGISEALNSTAFGLVAAIPALVAFAFFQSKLEKIMQELTQQTSEIYHDLLFYVETQKTSEATTGVIANSTQVSQENTIQTGN